MAGLALSQDGTTHQPDRIFTWIYPSECDFANIRPCGSHDIDLTDRSDHGLTPRHIVRYAFLLLASGSHPACTTANMLPSLTCDRSILLVLRKCSVIGPRLELHC
jgi:hypothetical protein